MPTFRSITLSLQSQHDAALLPEETIHPHPNTPPTNPATPSARTTTVTARVPTYPSSRFWICYSCPAPPPPAFSSSSSDNVPRFYFFKLYVGGRCLLSWGVGERDAWCGKTGFGLYDGGTDFEGRRVVVRRGFFFPSSSLVEGEGAGSGSGSGGGFEVRVFRSFARRRERGVEVERFEDQGMEEGGVG